MTTVLLADDHRIVREGLRSILDAEADLEVVGLADDGREAVRMATDLLPDVVVMDVSMPGLNGIEATRQICSSFPRVRVVGLSMHCDRRFVAGMLQAGAAGYLLKDCAHEDLVSAIRTVTANEVYLSPAVASVVVGDYLRRLAKTPEAASPELSDREREVLQLLAEGETAQGIAECLHVSVKTIETHRQRIIKKLGLRSVAQLTKYAVRVGITSLDK